MLHQEEGEGHCHCCREPKQPDHTDQHQTQEQACGSANMFEDNNSDNNSFCMAEEDVACMYPYCTEPDPLGKSKDKSDGNINK